MGPSGGYGGGGGAGYNFAGAGGGAPGGSSYGAGGYSYVIDTAREPFGITGGNPAGNGYVSINFVAVPEPSTWAMAVAGFAGLGWLARLRAPKPKPA
jgi:PEP-CTERM motif